MKPVVAYAGKPGAFAEEACRAFRPDHEPLACAGFADVASAVAEGNATVGMIPLENSIAGAVPGVAALIAETHLEIEARHGLPVRMHLLGLPGAELSALKIVRSHPVALDQCAGSLARLGLQPEEADNTAAAAQRLAQSGDTNAAVLASEHAARLYGLAILQRDLQDRPDNVTTFGVVRRAEPRA